MMTTPLKSLRLSMIAVGTFALCGLLLVAPLGTFAQTTGAAAQDYDTQRQRAFQLVDQSKFLEALPILEKLAIANPSDGTVAFALGFSLLASTSTMKEATERQKTRVRIRTLFLHAKEAGVNSDVLEKILASIPPDGGENDPSYSANKEADAAIREGEAAYAEGDLDKALAGYTKAFQLDPKLYEAALFAGDMRFKKAIELKEQGARQEQVALAGEWYARAIVIEPNRETAYRYWGDALLAIDKLDEARPKFIEAIIAEPFNSLSYDGLNKWAGRNNVQLAHPEIKQPPASMRASTEGKQTNIMIDPKRLDMSSADHYWTSYDLVRSTYRTASFQKDHPNEKEYRHSLKEESLALRIVAENAASDLKTGKVKTLDSSLVNLIKLSDAGLIEAYIFFARIDEGIARDYEDYRKTNRDKLRQYWTDIIVANAKKP